MPVSDAKITKKLEYQLICLNVICVFEIAVSDIKTTGLLDDCGHIRDRGMLIGCKTVRAKVQKRNSEAI